jgi:plastocyanin domain-containing protein
MEKITVVIISAALIGLIVWWFFGKHQTEAVQAEVIGNLQKVEILVEGGYKPEVVTLKPGIPAELTFVRKSASSCFDEVLLPDFGKQAALTINEPHVIAFTPKVDGVFTYSCGMHMFFGKIEVKS